MTEQFAERMEKNPRAETHSFLPLLKYTKRIRRYRAADHKTIFKDRPIMYPSHRDGCLLARYADRLTAILESQYEATPLAECVIAYRALGKGNYDFAREVLDKARQMAPCAILCFDVTKFFDTLDHGLLKRRLKQALGVAELPKDWYAVFRQMTRFHAIELDDLKTVFPERFGGHCGVRIASIDEVKDASVQIHANPDKFGIPQGTPLSSAFSNLYMMEFDATMAAFCAEIGGMYRRYCDDILVLCPTCRVADAEAFVAARLKNEKIELNGDKTEITAFDPTSAECAQYLGFRLSPAGARLRESSIGRQWRKLRKSVRRVRTVGEAAMAAGLADKVYTKKLRKRFAALHGKDARPIRNFSAYARRAAKALDSPNIVRQTRRLERELEREIAAFPKVP